MEIGLFFWIIMLVWLLFGFWQGRTEAGFNYPALGSALIVWALLALLGWRLFGAPLR